MRVQSVEPRLETLLPHCADPLRPIPETLQRLLRTVRAHLGMDVAFISEFVETRRVFRYVDTASEACPVRVGGSDLREDSYCQLVVDGRLPELMPDPAEDPIAAAMPVTAALPVGAHVSVPITLDDGSVFGTFCCFSFRPDQSLNARDLGFVRALADIAAQRLSEEVEGSRRREELLSRIGGVFEGDYLSMVFQPIFDLGSGKVDGFEGLSRFSAEPVRSPDHWFREAAEAGLGTALEVLAIRKAVAEMPALPPDAYLAINVSPVTILGGELEHALIGCSLGRIVLEITEHESVAEYADLNYALAVLRAGGLRVAVDDAGAGFSSMRHVLDLNPDIIKLDMSLTRNVDTDPGRRALTAALISFSNEIGSRIIAEGVETGAELSTLRSLGAKAAQGYFLGRPLPASQLLRHSC